MCCGHWHPKICPAAAFPVPLSPWSDDLAVLAMQSLCSSFPRNISILPACLPALLEKCACMGIRNHLHLGLGEFGDEVSCPSDQKQHNSTSIPCAMQGMLLACSFWVIPFACSYRVTSKCDQPAAPARFPLPVRSLHGRSSPFRLRKVGSSRVGLRAGSVAPAPPARHVQMTVKSAPRNAAQP